MAFLQTEPPDDIYDFHGVERGRSYAFRFVIDEQRLSWRPAKDGSRPSLALRRKARRHVDLDKGLLRHG
jgi:hypothetical protein